ncbi:MAG: saccharopine dehydrogenase [Ignavibacteria bacterium RIFOXYB2_FULL_35_12]|nr:MAG: saccharopine dehydrogenase [Ignavibacteria bacterium GWA2_36_19]OGU57119.1 MAG: saccharopine dehydrogenase [Ignavibacteria bacterium GWF2_35_20]OGU83433.1 MAG: saccharopine dehydrogenase [Ignavibacteria bacterium RIFOXYA2_FULL_35_9]OGU88879.1 MAG: saccharopine dehydrogenase [Ignavibacteria bacterium RIFOXYA12_FULL_35_25]OGU90623.1 MAG: saccharopine dehydrogenase [Ignavibacteria bacterium RIFOXYC12_FULL_35_11]OGU93645.1 MAG: saccharopine dehydrogenase [Ignavibacteria bacterium RIFOXYB12
MKKVLVLGAGLVSRPGVHYLLKQKNIQVTVASRTVSKAEVLVKGFPNGKAVQVNVENKDELTKLIKEHDIAISLLPWTHHLIVAELCIEHGKHMVTTSYVSPAMKALDEKVRAKNLLFLNEIGVDPGIDHMSAMKIIHEVEAEGGKVLHFYSYCGGLPAPKDNDNPFGYKFSWSPRGVVLASRNSAKYYENGKTIEVESKNLFANPEVEDIEGLGKFEVYPNRDSTPYKGDYNLKDALTVKRGTYRNIGWCETLRAIVNLGLVNETPVPAIKGSTFKKAMAYALQAKETDNLKELAAKKVGIPMNSKVIERMDWLGLFSDEVIPKADNLLDMLSDRMQEKLSFKEGEVDLLLLRHKFIVENKDKSKDLITSTLIDFGIPHGDSSMARTVSLPMAIATAMMADGRIEAIGVRIPNSKDIYEPVLAELENLNIKMVEKRSKM